MSTTVVTLDGFPLIGTTPEGGRAKLTGLKGWLSASQRRERAPRTGRHGGYSSTGLREPLEVAAAGFIVYPDAASCATERMALKALGGAGLDVALVVTDALAALTVDVDVDEADITVINDRLLGYAFTLVADDPFIRAATGNTPVTINAGNTGAVDNAGTAAADLIVTLTSGGTVVLTAGGQTLTTGVLPSGAVIDTGADTVRSSGGVDLSSLVVSPWQSPAVPAGGGSVSQAGTANLSVVSFDTYS